MLYGFLNLFLCINETMSFSKSFGSGMWGGERLDLSLSVVLFILRVTYVVFVKVKIGFPSHSFHVAVMFSHVAVRRRTYVH